MTDRTLSLLGLALRGGRLAAGEDALAEACRTGRAALVLTAADAADNSVDRADRLAARAGVPRAGLPCGREELGRALGKRSCAVLAVTDPGLAAAVLERLAGEGGGLKPLTAAPREKAGGRKEESGADGPAPAPRIATFRRWPV